VAGIQCASGKSGRAYAERGFGLITITKDSSLLQAGVKAELRAALGAAGGARDGYT
jgi:4-hydroxy-2-oxoheptanedioate aldolase